MNLKSMAYVVCLISTFLGCASQGKLVDKKTGYEFFHGNTVDPLRRKITFYHTAVEDHKKGLPLALFIQGSGCISYFTKRKDGEMRGYQNYLFRRSKNLNVAVIEKPGVKLGDINEKPGTAIGCSNQFLEEHTKDNYILALQSGLSSITKTLKPSRILVVGHSEGGLMAAFLAEKEKKVSHIALLASSPGKRNLSFIELAKMNKDQRFEGMTINEIDQKFIEIKNNSSSISDFAWGHPYRSIFSFGKKDIYRHLLKGKAKLFIVHGTNDLSTPYSIFKRGLDKLDKAKRSYTKLVIKDGSHSLSKPGQKSSEGMSETFKKVLDWFAE